jgi:hypothetical protein
VQQTGWLNEREFLVAVAMGMMSPGPVVITATFVGYLVAARFGASLLDPAGAMLKASASVLIIAAPTTGPAEAAHREWVGVGGAHGRGGACSTRSTYRPLSDVLLSPPSPETAAAISRGRAARIRRRLPGLEGGEAVSRTTPKRVIGAWVPRV